MDGEALTEVKTADVIGLEATDSARRRRGYIASSGPRVERASFERSQPCGHTVG
jgi:hypothetical protein